MADAYSRLALLNYVLADAKTRAKSEHKAPLHSAEDMFRMLETRLQQGVAIEIFDSDRADDEDEAVRIAGSANHDFIRLKKLQFLQKNDRQYVVMLVEAVDHTIKSMPVIHVINMNGRDLTGDENERGSSSAHVILRMPSLGQYDDGKYRCVIESVAGISRKRIELLFNRQLRRFAKATDMTFDVEMPGKRKAILRKTYKYSPALQLAASVGRDAFGKGQELSTMVFTRRSEKQKIASQTAIIQEEVLADVELRISATQGPADPGEKRNWLNALRNHYEKLGYTTKLYFRHIGSGQKFGGAVHKSLETAADIMLCSREEIATRHPPSKWVDDIQPDVRDAMIAILDRDELWKQNAT